MGICRVCGKESRFVSDFPGVCVDCIRTNFEESLRFIREAHRKARRAFSLPEVPPSQGVSCQLCSNSCKIPEGMTGYCGVRKNISGRVIGGTVKAKVSYYYDDLPTNCVAEWVCAGCTTAGYPGFSYIKGPEYGYRNLAVFYHACNFDCLFCQNWTYRKLVHEERYISIEKLVEAVDDRTSCVCFFGGDPTPQIINSIAVAKKARRKYRNRILRFCWETNGAMHPELLKSILKLALESGGCVKFDLKFFDERLNLALCGVSNRRTMENFALAASWTDLRKDLPLVIASTLLVPGYVDSREVRAIAEFIADLNREIPYTLLGFYPHFYMKDLPPTSWELALNCLEEAKKAGLTRVRLANMHLFV